MSPSKLEDDVSLNERRLLALGTLVTAALGALSFAFLAYCLPAFREMYEDLGTDVGKVPLSIVARAFVFQPGWLWILMGIVFVLLVVLKDWLVSARTARLINAVLAALILIGLPSLAWIVSYQLRAATAGLQVSP